jgi:hypothetical protein
MKLKITRKALLIVTASLGVLLILYTVVRHFILEPRGIIPPEKFEKYFTDGVILAALCLFVYNRRLAKEEKQAREAAEAEALNPRIEEPIPEEEDENLPHWERSSSSDEDSAEN